MSIAKILTSFLTLFSLFLEIILAVFGGGETPVEPPSTTEPPTSVTQPSNPDSDNVDGKFVFTTYGWGHGVGMSQDGAIQMAKDGKNYEEILLNFYTGTTIKPKSNKPIFARIARATTSAIPYAAYIA